jgi:hypothetical protein
MLLKKNDHFDLVAVKHDSFRGQTEKQLRCGESINAQMGHGNTIRSTGCAAVV